MDSRANIPCFYLLALPRQCWDYRQGDWGGEWEYLLFCLSVWGAGWPSGRVSDYGARGRGFNTYLRCVLSLSKDTFSQKVLVIPRKRWLSPNMTGKLLTGTLSIKTNKPIRNMEVLAWNSRRKTSQFPYSLGIEGCGYK